MKRFAGMKRKEEPFMRLCWKQGAGRITEKDFYIKGHSMTLTLEEIVREVIGPDGTHHLQGLMPVLQNGVVGLAQERLREQQEGETSPTALALPDGERTDSGIVLPPGVRRND